MEAVIRNMVSGLKKEEMEQLLKERKGLQLMYDAAAQSFKSYMRISRNENYSLVEALFTNAGTFNIIEAQLKYDILKSIAEELLPELSVEMNLLKTIFRSTREDYWINSINSLLSDVQTYRLKWNQLNDQYRGDIDRLMKEHLEEVAHKSTCTM